MEHERRANFKAEAITLVVSNVDEIHQMDNCADQLSYLLWKTALGEKDTH